MSKEDRRRKQIFTIIISILIIILYARILSFSGTSAETSAMQSLSVSEYIISIIEKTFSINLNLNESQFGQFEKFVRKAAHFFEYALLGFLVYSLPLIWGKKTFKPALYSFLAVVVMASVDEFIQLFVPERAALISDVIIDSIGCIAGMALLRLVYCIVSGIKNNLVRRKEDKVFSQEP
ncbi:MAG: VanZ family protein [Lachnospiraceae bacterium]|nr:VanZ family protein [Lachnospiraceae bacterium]